MRFACGVEYLLVGAPGDEDGVVTMAPPVSVPASFSVLGDDGNPLQAVRLRLARTSQNGLAMTDAAAWRFMIANNVVIVPVDQHGHAQHALIAGNHEVELLHAEHRDDLGFTWRPTSTQAIEVTESGRNTFVVRAPRPRRVLVELAVLAGQTPPDNWSLEAGAYSATFGGRSCRVWLTDAACDLRILGLDRRVLGTARLAAGPGDTAVTVLLSR